MDRIKNVLLIDDDTISSWLNKTMLEKTQLVETIVTLENGKSAIEYLQSCFSDSHDEEYTEPDLILLDLDMPGVNGFDVLNILQQSEKHDWLISDRIVVLTTSINPADMKRANAYQIYDFLVKPLTETKLKAVLENFLSRDNNGSLPDQKNEGGSQYTADREPVTNTIAAKTNERENESI